MIECVSGGHEADFKATNPDGTVWYFCLACGSCAGPADDVQVERLGEQTICRPDVAPDSDVPF